MLREELRILRKPQQIYYIHDEYPKPANTDTRVLYLNRTDWKELTKGYTIQVIQVVLKFSI